MTNTAQKIQYINEFRFQKLCGFKIGDRVSVDSDSNLGTFTDTIRDLFIQSDTLGDHYPAAVLTEHSWAQLDRCTVVA